MSQRSVNKDPYEYMGMTEKLKNYEFPPTTENRLIIRAMETGCGYIHDFEDGPMYRLLGEETLNDTVRKVNNICNKVYLKSRTEETKDFNSGSGWGFK